MNKVILKLFILSAVLYCISCGDDDVNREMYDLDESVSTIEWKGYSPNLFHVGSFSVTGQNMEVVDGILKNGSFTIPISSIKNFDLPDDIKPILLDHLKSADFFNMAIHPNAKFKITKVTANTNSSKDNKFTIIGDFTMLSQTHSISFPAIIKLEGNKLKLDAQFEINRTQWGMNYAADPALGEHHILPNVDIKLDILANNQ